MDISALPFFTPLAKDYVTQFDRAPIREFFALSPNALSPNALSPGAPPEQLRELLDRRIAHNRRVSQEHRTAVAASIRAYHTSLGALSQKTEKNLRSMESANTLAVVTGQQAGLLGGPLYTFYKAFTAIRLAESLQEQFPSCTFVPVFWIETEDHDLDEISSVNVLNADGALASVRYTPQFRSEHPTAAWKKQAAQTPLEAQPLAEFFDALRQAVQPTDFSEQTFDWFQSAYSSETNFGHAFATVLNRYFNDDGLLLLDANRKELKSLCTPLFRNEIETSPALSEQIVQQSEKLETHYHAQVKPRAINLFYLDDTGDRVSITENERSEKTERAFFLQGTQKAFAHSELIAELEIHPERFSPNVVMRPLYQDSLLPTVSYVAGPGEIAYFAQFAPAYRWAGVPMPLIHPRVSVTLIEERLERIVTKYDIAPEDVLLDGNGKNTALLDAAIESNVAPRFESALASIDATLESLRESVAQAEPTLDGALTSIKGKVLTTVRDFEAKTLSAERKRHATTKAQIDKLLSALLPGGQLQERELTMIYFINKYGFSFLQTLKTLLEPIALDFHEHHILHLRDGNSAS